MPAPRRVPRRYQLKKGATRVVEQGHPWIFRDQLSSAAQIFGPGQWLRLVDAQNRILAHGLYEPGGLIGIRVLRRGSRPPSTAWLRQRLLAALGQREMLRETTNAYRVVHGEGDGFSGIVIDVYGETCVLQTHSRGVDRLGRYLAGLVCRELRLPRLVWRHPAKRGRVRISGASFESSPGGPNAPTRILRGEPEDRVAVREGRLEYQVDVLAGQKTGTFLDLRGLRQWVDRQELGGRRVLNLFAYTGTLGLAAERAGAAEIWNVDISHEALRFGSRHHVLDPQRTHWIAEDAFEWVRRLPPAARFDLIIMDPPSMAANSRQVPRALAAYRRLYRSLGAALAPGGTLVACCCTSRIGRQEFRQTVTEALAGRASLSQEIPPEVDHPVTFREGDYLKLLVYSGVDSP